MHIQHIFMNKLNKILGSHFMSNIIYLKVCTVKWLPLIKYALTLRGLCIFPYNLCHHNSVVESFGFMTTKTEWWLWIKGNERHIWHLQYAWPNTVAMPCLWVPAAFHTDKHRGQRAQRSSLSYSDTSLSSCLWTDLLIFQTASCACVCFVIFPVVLQHAEAVSDHNTL